MLVKVLRQAGHDVLLPADLRVAGTDDPVHLRHAIREHRVFLTHNYDDFLLLHELLLEGQGHHPGILVVRRDNNPQRDMKPPNIVRAITKLTAAGVSIPDEYIVLNQWR